MVNNFCFNGVVLGGREDPLGILVGKDWNLTFGSVRWDLVIFIFI